MDSYFRTPYLHAELIRIRGIELDLTNSVRPGFSLHDLSDPLLAHSSACLQMVALNNMH